MTNVEKQNISYATLVSEVFDAVNDFCQIMNDMHYGYQWVIDNLEENPQHIIDTINTLLKDHASEIQYGLAIGDLSVKIRSEKMSNASQAIKKYINQNKHK